MALAGTIRSEIEIMVAERRGVVTHTRQQLQFAAGLADRGSKRGPHAVVARIKYQHWSLVCARLFPLRDQTRQTSNPPRVESSLSVNGV